jgi:hypothetical protein
MNSARTWLWILGLGLCSSCECGTRRHAEASPGAETASANSGSPASATLLPEAGARTAPWQPRAYAPDETDQTEEKDTPPILPGASVVREGAEATGSVVGALIIDSLVDVAAAGPATATEHGVVMVNRDNQLQLARLREPLRATRTPHETAISPLPDSAGPFPLGKGPAVRLGQAFWVSRGRLLTQSVSAAGRGNVVTLTEDARVGTRVAVPVGPQSYLDALPQLVAYITRAKQADGPLGAQLWVEGRSEPLQLTDDVAAAHSVALAATSYGVAALFLEARTGMSSIHLRPVRVSKSVPPSLDEERIVWIGGPGRPSTELLALGADSTSVWMSMALERDMTHFGLLELRTPLDSHALSLEPDWLIYANGIEPAPFAGASVCGRNMIALARPTSAVPSAPQELVLLDLDGTPAGAGTVLGRAREFFGVSLSALGNGALLSYVADHRTWARSLRCTGAEPRGH